MRPFVPFILVLFAASPRPWPLHLEPTTVEPTTVERVDLNADGVMDERFSGSDGGSGYHEYWRCARDGASGHAACELFSDTAYSLFAAEQRALDPATDNRAAALLPASDCAAYDPESASQAAMFQLLVPTPTSGSYTPTLRWFPGPPADQASVCMTVAQAAKFPGGLAFEASGEFSPEQIAGDGWTLRYQAAWPQLTPPGQPHNRTPKPVLELGKLRVYQHGHALAVYDPALNRHAWLANFAAPTGDGFKLDRWERIAGLRAVGPRTLELTIAREGPLRIELPP